MEHVIAPNIRQTCSRCQISRQKEKRKNIWESSFSLCFNFKAPTRTLPGSRKKFKMEDKEAELRAKKKLILYSDTRADSKRSLTWPTSTPAKLTLSSRTTA